MSQSPADDTTVLIAGAGPVGLTLAIELARRGTPFRLIDPKSGPTAESRALGLQSRTLEHFENLGVADRVLALGRKLHALNAYDVGRRVAHVGLDLSRLGTPFPFVVVLPQSDTERVLVERLRELGGFVEWGTHLQSFVLTPGGVSVTLTDASGREHAGGAAWLVGTDGAHSVVRHGLGVTFEGAAYPELFLLADVRVGWDLPADELHALLGPGGAVAAFPLPGPGRWRLVDTSGTLDSNDPGRVVGHFQELLRALGHPSATVSDPTWVSAFRVHRRHADRLRVGRGFLAGDAGHIHSPVGGQGLNTGVQDACNLGWKLSAVAAGLAPDSLLDSYSVERLPVVAGVLRGTDLMTRAVTLRAPVARGVRNRAVGLLTRVGVVRRGLALRLSELGVNYRGSPIVGEHQPTLADDLRSGTWHARRAFARGPGPGERVPDVSFEGRRLFDALRGAGHHLLLFEGEGEGGTALRETARLATAALGDRVAVAQVTRAARPDDALPTWPDPSGALTRHFGAVGPCTYLIRPDGYVGYRSRPAEPARFAAYLGKLSVGDLG